MELQLKRILKQKIALMNSDAAFMGALAFGMPTIRNDSVGTFATDGFKIYYNDACCESFSNDEIRAVIVHEMHHMIFDHVSQFREDSVDKDKANRAMDYVINDIISRNRSYGTLPPWVLRDPKYTYEWTWQQVYKDLVDTGGKGSGSGSGSKTIDNHSKFGAGKSATEEDVRDAMKRAAGSVGIDKVPPMFRSMLADPTASSYSWKKMLRKVIPLPLVKDRSYSIASRRTFKGQNFIKQGLVREETMRIAVAIDTSGSISNEDLNAFFTELMNIIAVIPNVTIDIWCFDTSIHNHQKYNSFNSKKVMKYEPAGGGGTLFEVNFNYIENTNINPDIFIMMTDGCPGHTWGHALKCDTVFVIKNPGKPVPPFGKAVYLDA